MFEKLVKMQMRQNSALFLGVAVSMSMGMLWFGTVLSGFPPYEPFEFAPGVFFLTVAAFVWTKVLYDLMNKSFQAPESTLMMSLPVSEETIVQSKIFVGTIAGSILALLSGIIILYWGVLGGGLDVFLTGIASMYVDLDYPAVVAAFCIGLIPILAAAEQLFFCSLLLLVALTFRGSILLQKCAGLVYVMLMILQIGVCLWLAMGYEALIGWLHPLALAGILLAALGIGTLLLYRTCVKRLKYRYAD